MDILTMTISVGSSKRRIAIVDLLKLLHPLCFDPGYQVQQLVMVNLLPPLCFDPGEPVQQLVIVDLLILLLPL